MQYVSEKNHKNCGNVIWDQHIINPVIKTVFIRLELAWSNNCEAEQIKYKMSL